MQCVDSPAHTSVLCSHPLSSTNHLSATLGLGPHMLAVLPSSRRTTWEGAHTGTGSRFGVGIWTGNFRIPGTRGKCRKGRVLVLGGHVPLGQKTLFPFEKDVAGGRLEGGPGQSLQ